MNVTVAVSVEVAPNSAYTGNNDNQKQIILRKILLWYSVFVPQIEFI